MSTRFLIACLTHKTRIKERQEVLERFKAGLYLAIVASKVLNEGVDVPEASVGVGLSGSSVAREFVQRLGRLLRRSGGKRAVLYEVVARATREERVAERRRIGVGVDSLRLDLLLDAPTRGEGFGTERCLLKWRDVCSLATWKLAGARKCDLPGTSLFELSEH